MSTSEFFSFRLMYQGSKAVCRAKWKMGTCALCLYSSLGTTKRIFFFSLLYLGIRRSQSVEGGMELMIEYNINSSRDLD